MTKDVSDFANRKIRTSSKTFTYGEGPWGSKRLRIAMADHMNKYFHPVSTVQPEDLVFANGITSLCELFGYAMGEEGDGILISRPCYQAFIADFGAKAKYALISTPRLSSCRDWQVQNQMCFRAQQWHRPILCRDSRIIRNSPPQSQSRRHKRSRSSSL